MSSSAYYSFMTTTTTTTTADKTVPPQTHQHNHRSTGGAAGVCSASLEAHRRSAMFSPSSSSYFANSSFSSSSNTSSSSLNQFNSLTQAGGSAINRPHDSSPSSSNCSSTSFASSNATSSSSSHPTTGNQSTTTTTTASTTPTTTQDQRSNHQELPQKDLQRKSSMTTAMLQCSSRHSPQLFHSYTLHSLEPKPFRPFKTKSDYIEAMKEDLAEWLNQLYPDLDLTPENFFSQLETGAIICRHANNVTLMGRNLVQNHSPDPHHSLNESSYGSIINEPNNNNNNFGHHRANSNSPMSSASSNDFSLTSSSTSKSAALLSPRQSITSLSRAAADINWFWVKMIPYKEQAKPGTFFARDNICQFILWCRSLNILECLLFETDDLVARKNEKSFILCLLEVARIGFKVGMPTPLIIQLEQEIDREIEEEAKLEAKKQNQITETISQLGGGESCSDLDDSGGGSSRRTSDDEHEEACIKQAEEQLDIEKKHETSLDDEQTKQSEEEDNEDVEEEDYGPKPQVITNDLLSLHERVVQLLCQCTCPTQFPMVRVGDNGKYKIGDKLIIFVRILRRHIMVRVGGGWQELSEFLRAKDPCRSKLSFNHSHHHHHSTASMSPSSFHQQSNHNHHGSQTIRQPSFSSVSKSRLLDTSLPSRSNIPTIGQSSTNGVGLSRATIQRANSPASSMGRHRFISSSASMSWISNNS